ncbi:MAG: hypothetical protein ACU837_09990 [Gammaproteobacteria bacterium]
MTIAEAASTRVILFYKGDISALMLFAQHPGGSVCAPQPLPKLSEVLEADDIQAPTVAQHPAAIVRTINDAMGLPANFLKAEPGFCERVDTPQGIVTVYLGRFDMLDPPHAVMQSKNCRLLTLMELRGQPPAELELLRRAYASAMES